MSEPTDDYSNFYDAHGRPVRTEVQLSEAERDLYVQYFPETTTEETSR